LQRVGWQPLPYLDTAMKAQLSAIRDGGLSARRTNVRICRDPRARLCLTENPSPERRINASRKFDKPRRLTSNLRVLAWLVAEGARWAMRA